jgi:endonuclease IV
MNIGIHVKIDDNETLSKSLRANVKILDSKCAQVFTHGPRGFKKNNYNTQEIKQIVTENNLDLSVHASYMLNPWSNKNNRQAFMVKMVIDELLSAYEIGAKWLVIHLPTKQKHSEIVDALKIINDKINKHPKSADLLSVIICLEHKAHKTPEKWSTRKHFMLPDQLNHLANKIVEAKISDNIGYCIDTAHMYVSTLDNDYESEDGMNKYLSSLNNNAVELIKIIHYNGIENKAGSGADKHAIPFVSDDQLWGENKGGAKSLINWNKHVKKNIPMIIEYNRGILEQLKKSINISREIYNRL